MDIRLANAADEARWDSFIECFHEAPPYCLFAWKKAVEKAYGFSCPYLLAEDADASLCGALPLAHVKPPFRPGALVSLPYCDAGGIWAKDSEVAAALLARAMELAREMRAKRIELRMFTPAEGGDSFTPLPANKVRMLLPLPANADELLADFKAKLRSQVKKPAKDGLTCQIGGAELLPQFYTVFGEGMRDLGSPPHSKEWFAGILTYFGVRARIGLVSMPDGTPAAAGIILCCGKSVSIPWASSLRRCNRYNPNMLLYWTFLLFAITNGYQQFDFGRSTPGEGTYRFKEQWGARPSPLFWATTEFSQTTNSANSSNHPSLSTKLRPHLEMLLQHLPIPVSNLIGARLRRYISL